MVSISSSVGEKKKNEHEVEVEVEVGVEVGAKNEAESGFSSNSRKHDGIRAPISDLKKERSIGELLQVSA
jgi:hypothetical protein